MSRINQHYNVLRAHTHDGINTCTGGPNCTLGGYDQIQNVSINGGTWDRGQNCNNYNTAAFIFRHGFNISFNNMIIEHCSDHFINVSGCNGVTVSNVTFQDALMNPDFQNSTTPYIWIYVEAIHTNYLYQGGEDSPLARPWDNTPTINFTVTGCTFSHVMSGIGTHHSPGIQNSRGYNYTITNNTFEYLYGYCLCIYDFDDVVFSGNDCSYCTSMVLAYNSTSVTLDNNYHYSTYDDSNSDKSRSVVYFSGVSDSEITNNTITDSFKTGIQIRNSSDNILVEDNIIDGSSEYSLFAYDSSDISFLGNTVDGTGAGYSAIQVELLTGNTLIEDNDILSTSALLKPGSSSTYADGINVKNSDGVVITGNYITNTGRRGIFIRYDSDDCYITENTIYDVPDTGIFVGSTDSSVSYNYNVTIEYNQIDTTGQYGIALLRCNGAVVDHNTIQENTYVPIYQYNCVNCSVVEYLLGWYYDGTHYYYYPSEGVMQTGWKQINGNWFYFGNNGIMVTGWQQIGGSWYLFGGRGKMLTGWQQSGGNWYYLESNGVMVTGWKQINNKWYYFNSNGVMVTGWQQINNKWYFFNSDGSMKTGWHQSGGNWYYLDSSGAMVAGTSMVINGVTYYFDSNGVCLNP